MNIHMIGTLRDDKDNIVGFRIFAPEYEQYKDVPYADVEADVKKSSTVIRELEYDHDNHSGIKGSCGSLDCYPKIYANGAVANNSTAIIINKGTDDNGNNMFTIYNYLGKKVEISEADLIQAVEAGKTALANGKILTNSNSGKKSIACKNGSFDTEMQDVQVQSMKTGESFNVKVSGNHSINDTTTVRVEPGNKKSLAEELGITQLKMDNPFINGKEVDHNIVLAKTMQKTNDYEEVEMTIEQKFTLALNIVNDVRPFYYSMISTVGNIPTNDVPTMGVSLNKLYWSPNFVSVLSAEEVAFILMHETLHLAMSHNARKGDRYAQLWNVACDYFVNTTLLQELGIKEPGQTVVVTRNMGGGKPRKITVQDDGLYLPFETDLSHLTPEIIYSELYEMARQESAKQAAQQGNQSGQGGNQGQQSQSGQGQQNGQQGNQNGQSGNQATSSNMTPQQAANQIAQGIKEVLEGAKEAQQNSGNSPEAQQAAQQITQGARNVMDSANKQLNNKGNQQQNRQQGQAGTGMMNSGINKMDKAQQNGQGQQSDQQGNQSGQQSGQNGNQGNQGQQSQGQNGQGSQSGQQGQQGNQSSQSGTQNGNQSASNKMQSGMNKIRQGLKNLANSQGQGQGQGTGMGSGQGGQNGNQQGRGQQGNQSGQAGGQGPLDLSVLNGKQYRGTTISGLSNDNDQDLVNDSKSENLSQERAQQIAESVLRRAVTNHKMSGKSFGGEAGSFLERYVEEALAPKVNWKKVLKRKLTALAEKENSFSSPDKRFISRDRILPGPRDAEPGALEGVKICIDTSGSISNEDLGIALAQIKQLLKIYKAKAELMYWDTQVHCGYDFDNTSFNEILKKKPLGGGGTDVNCVFEYFNQCKDYKSGKKQAPSVIIVFTDGYFGEVERKYAKKYKDTIWVICSDSDRERFKAPFGTVAELKNGN